MTSNRYTRWFSLLALLTSPLFAAEPRLLASGELSGRSGHEASGTVQLLQTEQGLVLQLAENFLLMAHRLHAWVLAATAFSTTAGLRR